MKLEEHHVYIFAKVIGDDLTAPVKVGISKNVEGRLSSISTACPFKVDLFYALSCPTREIALELERAFHEAQRQWRQNGEWFDLHPAHAIRFLCGHFRDHFARIAPPGHPKVQGFLEKAGVLFAEERLRIVNSQVTMQ